MSEIKFENWRLTAFWIIMASSTLVAGFVLGWCWRDRSGALANVSLLNALTAIGTVGAVIVALVVPQRQNQARLLEQKSIALSRDWIAAHIAYQITTHLGELVKRWIKGEFSSSSEFSAVVVRLNRLQDRVDSVPGITTISSLVMIASDFEGNVKSQEQSAMRGAAQKLSYPGIYPQDLFTKSQLDIYKNRIDHLKATCQGWMASVREDALARNIEVPGITQADLVKAHMNATSG